jgi:hypothetical protein
LIEHLFQEQRHSALALLEASHEQCRERHQPRSGLALGHTGRKFATGRFLAARASQPMQLVLRHFRLDLGNLPDLVSQWFGVGAGKRLATPTATLRLEGDDRLTLIGRNQRSLVFRVSGLTARLPAALFPRSGRFGMGVFGTWRQGRVSRRLVQASFEFADLRQQQANNGLRFRWLPGNQVFRDQWLLRHSHCVADFASGAKIIFGGPASPGCERLPSKAMS